ncbi:MAG: hypothetical protein KIH63_000285 [Candidatus Saccharibacteria bacterium]|nr:hypothetical protein [Candidatus Saccharibacteria bacterium]
MFKKHKEAIVGTTLVVSLINAAVASLLFMFSMNSNPVDASGDGGPAVLLFLFVFMLSFLFVLILGAINLSVIIYSFRRKKQFDRQWRTVLWLSLILTLSSLVLVVVPTLVAFLAPAQ